MRAEFNHEIQIDLPVEEALPLFTPKGEELWVPGWRPRYISPPSGETREEMLFVTEAEGETTVWTCLRWQPAQGHARYLRVTPGSRISFVDVSCRAHGPSRTVARVSYEHFALTAEGQAFIGKLSPASFTEMIDGWAGLIADHMRTRRTASEGANGPSGDWRRLR